MENAGLMFHSWIINWQQFIRKALNKKAKVDFSGKNLKLHLGCGYEKLDGFINIDSSSDSMADLVLDFRDIGKRFSPGTVSEVRMIHAISYLSLWEARDLFKNIYMLLENKGKFILEFPDIIKCCRLMIESRENLQAYLEAVRPFYAFDLIQVNLRKKYQPYAFGWSEWHIIKELKAVGFNEIQAKPPETHGQLIHRDVKIEANK